MIASSPCERSHRTCELPDAAIKPGLSSGGRWVGFRNNSNASISMAISAFVKPCRDWTTSSRVTKSSKSRSLVLVLSLPLASKKKSCTMFWSGVKPRRWITAANSCMSMRPLQLASASRKATQHFFELQLPHAPGPDQELAPRDGHRVEEPPVLIRRRPQAQDLPDEAACGGAAELGERGPEARRLHLELPRNKGVLGRRRCERAEDLGRAVQIRSHHEALDGTQDRQQEDERVEVDTPRNPTGASNRQGSIHVPTGDSKPEFPQDNVNRLHIDRVIAVLGAELELLLQLCVLKACIPLDQRCEGEEAHAIVTQGLRGDCCNLMRRGDQKAQVRQGFAQAVGEHRRDAD
mmetsp:Transcript_105452/g.339573  ORF Transcript_105452/g.339573 Transcript_105452/m.339573 type:complete len:349 (-) Transcript_105452:510-1556(-)